MKSFLIFILLSLFTSCSVFASGEQEWNGHYYGYVDSNGTSWNQANTEAGNLYYNGLKGNLITIASQGESDALTGFLSAWPTLAYRWIGAYQLPNQNAVDAGWHWVTGEPWAYTNWHSDNNPANFVGLEPNDAQTTPGIEDNEEQSAFFSEVLGDASKPWYDAPGNINYSDGYLVEFAPTVSPEPISATLFFVGGSVLGFAEWLKRRSNRSVS